MLTRRTVSVPAQVVRRAPPRHAPTCRPGIKIVPAPVPGGSYSPRLLNFFNSSFAQAFFSGERSVRSSSVSPCRENGSGFKGIGWVGQACSPSREEEGTGLSSIGKRDSPVSLSRRRSEERRVGKECRLRVLG